MPSFDLDHVGVVTRDLEAGRAAFKRLGFALTPRSMHSGATRPGGPVEAWASGNHCAMLGQGYLEILGEARSGGFSSVRHLFERYEGIHMVVFNSSAPASDVHVELRRRGIDAGASRYLERPAAFGPLMQEKRLARFNNVYVEPHAFPHATVIFIQHLTPEVLWQPHLLGQPNGVTGLTELGFASADPAATSECLAQLLDVPSRAGDEEGAPQVIALAHTRLCVVDSRTWAARYPGQALPWPAPAWIGFGVSSIAETARYLVAAGVAIRRDASSVWVGPEWACGAVLRFTENGNTTNG
jgi:hypothetical protein